MDVVSDGRPLAGKAVAQREEWAINQEDQDTAFKAFDPNLEERETLPGTFCKQRVSR
jgi:hypothetical protein